VTCIADFGQFIEIGKKDSMSNGRLEMGPFLRNVSYSGVDLAPIFTDKPAKAAQLLARILQLASEEKIHPAYPLTVMNFSELEAGFRLLQSSKGMGKIVFKPHKDDLVPVSPPLHAQCCKGFADKVQDRAKILSPYEFRKDASYVLSGGLGGLGRSLARWMVSRGARYLLFLSRSGASSDAAKALVEELEAKSCHITVRICDVSDKEKLKETIEKYTSTMPPIMGMYTRCHGTSGTFALDE
jgi:hypothetical protein